MKIISSKTDYALRAVFELALNYGKEYLETSEIARKQAIPKRYLEHILIALKKAGLLSSSRGKKGGYALLKSPPEIKVGEIVNAIEGPIDFLPQDKRSQIFGVWAAAQTAVTDVFNSISLEDLVNKKRQVERISTYYI